MIQVKTPKFKSKTFDQKLIDTTLDRLAAQAMTNTRNRTTSGKDVNSKDFTPYAPSTLAKKKKQGAYKGRVNLLDEGVMLESLTTTRFTNGFKMFLMSSGRIDVAERHQEGLGKLPQRKWFGPDKEFTAKVKRELRKALRLK